MSKCCGIRPRCCARAEIEKCALETYDTTFVPANIIHRFRNASDTEEMKIFWTYASIDVTRTMAGTTTRNRIDEEQANQPAAGPAAPADTEGVSA